MREKKRNEDRQRFGAMYPTASMLSFKIAPFLRA
jgi:hypothetical protein